MLGKARAAPEAVPPQQPPVPGMPPPHVMAQMPPPHVVAQMPPQQQQFLAQQFELMQRHHQQQMLHNNTGRLPPPPPQPGAAGMLQNPVLALGMPCP